MEFFSKSFNELNATELYEILKSRTEIFVIEQKIFYQDMDDKDYDCLHCFITENKRVIAYLRAFYENDETVKIGRVLTLKHGNGIGKRLMTESLKAVKEKMSCKKIIMDAQKYAAGFYEKFGFKIISDDFLEEGIVHVAMESEV